MTLHRRSMIVASASFVLAALLLPPTAAAQEGKIVLANDEWTLSDTGFNSAPDTARYVQNLADWFTGGGAANFLAYSDNFGLTESILDQTMVSLGHTWTVSTTITFDLPTLQQFDAVFLCGFAANTNVLEDYVRAGGHVYIAGGARGFGGDAQLWNPLLNRFGLGFDANTNGRVGVLPIQLNHPLFHGITGLYQNNGTDPIDRDDNDCVQRILYSEGGNELYAVFNGNTEIELHVDSPGFLAGDLVEISVGLGQAGKRMVLVAEDVNGFDVFVQIFLGSFGPECRWEQAATLPSGLTGITTTLVAYGIGFSGKIQPSNPVLVQFQ